MGKTKEQQTIYDKFIEECFQECDESLAKALAAHMSVQKLPYKNEKNEPVLQIDNIHMYKVRDYHLQKVRTIFDELKNDQKNELNKKYPQWQSSWRLFSNRN